jgi:Rrf2 family protein
MRLSEGVEWAAHAAALLATLPKGHVLSRARLAEYLGVPPPYLAKHMQALSRAGLVETRRGPAGGYRLACAPADITLNDIAIAIEGREPAFRCQEIRRRGPVGAAKEACKRPCGIARSFGAAERAWREELSRMTLIDVVKDAARSFDASRSKRFTAWLTDASASIASSLSE